MPDIDLKYAFGLKPDEAIEYFKTRAQEYATTWDWHEMLDDAHARAFTVAKVMKVDILEDIRAEVQKGLESGITYAEFKNNLIPRLKAKGWWGEIVNETTGEVANVGPWRLRTIFDTNVQTAYMTGHYRAAMENTADRPWWMYTALMDKRTRPAHAALNGLVFRYDDPFWNSHFPHNGFRCRCSVRFLDDEGLAHRLRSGTAGRRSTVGPDADAKLNEIEKPLDKAGMKTTRVTAVKTTGLDGRPVAMAPDAGWNYNPGKAGWQPDLEKIDHRIARQYIKESLAGPNFERFFAGKMAGNFPVAVLRPEDKTALGSEAQTVLLSQETLREHVEKHPDVGLDDYRKIPDIIDNGEVYQQNDTRLIYLILDEKLYRAGLKRTKDRKTNFFLTLFETTTARAKRQVVDKYERIR